MSSTLEEKYADKVILLTGATGFLGKVVLERILWEFQSTREVRVLLRGTRKQTAAQRLQAMWDLPIFDRLRLRCGGPVSFAELVGGRTVAVEGDIESDRLGMSAQAYAAAQSELDIVIHCAALVSWDERLDRSINANALGTQRLLQLASGTDPNQSQRRVKFLYVSSAFVNGLRCERRHCRETLPDPECSIMAELHPDKAPPFSLDRELRAAAEYAQRAEERSRADIERWRAEARKRCAAGAAGATVAEATEQLRRRAVHRDVTQWGMQRARSHGWFDNYTFSKALAEMVLVRDCPPHVDLSIVRPSGITAAVRQPVPGWLDAYLLVEPLIHGMGTGDITAFPGRPANVIDVVPVDMVTSVMLAAAAPSALPPASPSQVRMFHVGSGSQHPITLGQIEATWRNYFKANPMWDSRGRPVKVAAVQFHSDVQSFAQGIERKFLRPLQWAQWAIERVPLWTALPPLRSQWNNVSRLIGRVNKTLRLADLYCTYTLNEWVFQTEETERLMNQLAPPDRASFSFDVPAIDWTHFWTEVHIPYMRKHLLKEAPREVKADSKL